MLSDQRIFARVVFDRFTKKKLSFIQARKMLVILPCIRELLEDGHSNIKTDVLVIFRNVMRHLERKEASAIAVQLAEKLLPLFDAVRLMGETEPCRWALCNESCPSAQPRGQHSEQGLLPRALLGRLLGFAAQHGFSLLQNLTPEHLPSHLPCSRPWANAHSKQGAALSQVPLSFSLPGVQPAARALHQPLQRPGGGCGGE